MYKQTHLAFIFTLPNGPPKTSPRLRSTLLSLINELPPHLSKEPEILLREFENILLRPKSDDRKGTNGWEAVSPL